MRRISGRCAAWLAWPVFLACLAAGCQVCHLFQPTDPAKQHFEKGQAALEAGQPDLAIECFRQSLNEKQPKDRIHLSLAAAYLQKGQDEAACVELARFLWKNPEHKSARFYHAALLQKLGRLEEARREYERFVGSLQEAPDLDLRHMIHCHGRLLHLAEEEGDAYEAYLQRGMGLYWLAQGRVEAGDPAGEFPAEGLLWKAAAELAEARRLRPAEARPAWYLFCIWRKLAQTGPAEQCLREALDSAPFSDLTPAEQRSLQLAMHQWVKTSPGR